jgi:hypothetical protein
MMMMRMRMRMRMKMRMIREEIRRHWIHVHGLLRPCESSSLRRCRESMELLLEVAAMAIPSLRRRIGSIAIASGRRHRRSSAETPQQGETLTWEARIHGSCAS